MTHPLNELDEGLAQKHQLGPKAPRAFNRIAEQIERYGCPICHKRLTAWQPYYVAKVHGRWTCRCETCRGDLYGRVFIATAGGFYDPWAADDKEWFASHPGRSWRLRQPMPGEIDDLIRAYRQDARTRGGVASHYRSADHRKRQYLISPEDHPSRLEPEEILGIAVFQMRPGARVRQPFVYTAKDIAEHGPIEECSDDLIKEMLGALVDSAEAYIRANDTATEEAMEKKYAERQEVRAKEFADRLKMQYLTEIAKGVE